MKKFILAFLSTLIFLGCNDDDIDQRPMSINEISNCYKQQEWNENKIAEELKGKWQWIYTENFWSPDKGRNTENEKLIVEFNSDTTLKVHINNELNDSTRWFVLPLTNSDLYVLELEKPIQQLYGQILFCENILMFFDSYRDGTDNYFRKVD
jgi:hypothetical protein